MPEKNEEKIENKESTEHFHDFHHHKHPLKILLLILGILVIVGGIFIVAGLTFRFSKSSRRNINFVENRNFGGGGMMGGGFRGGFGRGISGQITAMNGSNITVESGGKAYTIVTSDSTSVRLGNGDIGKLSDLQENYAVTVIGSSNANGQINATLISIQ